MNGRKEGPVKFLDASGKLQATGNYREDSRNGTWITYGPAGDTLSLMQFHQGRKEGLQAHWSTDGGLLRLERFRQGAPDGALWRFFADGSARQYTLYRNGQADGPYLEWYKVDSTSVALTVGQFIQGKRSGTWRWVYGNGRPASWGRYRHGERAGPWLYWTPQGELRPIAWHGR